MDVFVYGTLTDPHVAAGVLEEHAYGPPATLYGLERVDGEYPTLGPGTAVEGTVLRTDDVAGLDAYEGVDDGLYVRVSVPAPPGPVSTYIGDPAALGADVDWPEGFSEAAVQAYVDEHCVVEPD